MADSLRLAPDSYPGVPPAAASSPWKFVRTPQNLARARSSAPLKAPGAAGLREHFLEINLLRFYYSPLRKEEV